MRLVLGYDADIADWVARKIPHMAQPLAEEVFGRAFGPSAAIGVVGSDGLLRGGVVYHGYQPQFRNIEVSCASTHHRWLSRAMITGIFAYPFAQLGCQRLTSVTPKRNHAARKFLEELGFKREGVARVGFGDDDAVIYGLLKSEWDRSRWNLRRAEAPYSSAILSQGSSERVARVEERRRQSAGSS